MSGKKKATTKGAFRAGTSGWVYKHAGKFYPNHLDSSEYLSFYSDEFDTAELNYSFYKLPTPQNYVEWSENVEQGFTERVSRLRERATRAHFKLTAGF